MTGVQGAETARATKAPRQGRRRRSHGLTPKAQGARGTRKGARLRKRSDEARREAERKGARRREKAQGGEKGAAKQ